MKQSFCGCSLQNGTKIISIGHLVNFLIIFKCLFDFDASFLKMLSTVS